MESLGLLHLYYGDGKASTIIELHFCFVVL